MIRDLRPPTATPSSRGGFGLIELITALVILSIALLGFGGATARLGSGTARSVVELTALAHVEDRIDRILAEPAYDSLEAWFAGSETGLEGVPSSTRVTRVNHVREVLGAGRFLDYKRITTTVSAPALERPISRTITVAAP